MYTIVKAERGNGVDATNRYTASAAGPLALGEGKRGCR